MSKEKNQKYNMLQRIFRKKYLKQIDELEGNLNISYTEKFELQNEVAALKKEKESLLEKKSLLEESIRDLRNISSKLKNDAKKNQELLSIYDYMVPSVKDQGISFNAVKRDEIVFEKLLFLKNMLELSYSKEQYGSLTTEERLENEKRIRRIKSEVIGAVAAYRDLLPKDELKHLDINGKDYSTFLQDNLKSIIKTTDKSERYYNDITLLNEYEKTNKNYGDTSISVGISSSDLDDMRYSYRSITSKLDVEARKNYSYATIKPFEFRIKPSIHRVLDCRSDGYALYSNILTKEDRVLNLCGSDANLSRVTVDSEKPSRVEALINEIDNTITNRVCASIKDQLVVSQKLNSFDLEDKPRVYIANHR